MLASKCCALGGGKQPPSSSSQSIPGEGIAYRSHVVHDNISRAARPRPGCWPQASAGSSGTWGCLGWAHRGPPAGRGQIRTTIRPSAYPCLLSQQLALYSHGRSLARLHSFCRDRGPALLPIWLLIKMPEAFDGYASCLNNAFCESAGTRPAFTLKTQHRMAYHHECVGLTALDVNCGLILQHVPCL